MLVGRMLSLGIGAVAAGIVATLGLTQVAFGFLRAPRGRERGLPRHEDPASVTKYPEGTLEALRSVGDPETGRLIERISGRGGAKSAAEPQGQAEQQTAGENPATPQQVTNVERFYEKVLDQVAFDVNDFARESYAGDLRAWDGRVVVPVAVDGRPLNMARLERAGDFFRDHLFEIVLILSTSSLLEAYACLNGVQVLARTNYLSRDAQRRLKETLQFVMFVNERDGFKPNGKALAAIKKVRLMHGCIRWLIREKAYRQAGDWLPQYGLPINGEDLLGTLMTFSGVVIRDLPELRVSPTEEEAEDYLYLWRAVGQPLGVNVLLMPKNLGEALALIQTIKRRQQFQSDQGTEMASALLRYHQVVLGDTMLPAATATMRRLVGDEISDWFGVPYTDLARRTRVSDFIFEVLLTWGKLFLSHTGLTVDGETYQRYEIPASLFSTVYPDDPRSDLN